MQLRAGQRIVFADLLRATAVKGANDAATAIGEGIDGSLSIFARRMNVMAKELGMDRVGFEIHMALQKQDIYQLHTILAHYLLR